MVRMNCFHLPPHKSTPTKVGKLLMSGITVVVWIYCLLLPHSNCDSTQTCSPSQSNQNEHHSILITIVALQLKCLRAHSGFGRSIRHKHIATSNFKPFVPDTGLPFSSCTMFSRVRISVLSLVVFSCVYSVALYVSHLTNNKGTFT